MNRLLIFAHYNPHNIVSGDVYHWLENLRPVFRRMVFVSNSSLEHADHKAIESLCEKVIVRGNNGFDFGAWKDALLAEGHNELMDYDSISLMNDTCFGPLFDMEEVYSGMETREVDFWGITSHQATKTGMPGTNGPIPFHIQSYFLVFNKSIVSSLAFLRFWKKVKHYKKVAKTIKNYETRLTQYFCKYGFRQDTYLKNNSLVNLKENLSVYHPDILIRKKSPFLKKKSFLHFKHPGHLKKIVSEYSDYDTALIDNYFEETFTPNDSIALVDNLIWVRDNNLQPDKSSLKIAMHFHVFYLDVFDKYLPDLLNNGCDYDLFITTDTEDKRSKILALFDRLTKSPRLREVKVVENRGRDTLPWLSMASKLNTYDVVGHFHTKKALTADEWVGVSWLEELVKVLIRPMPQIIEAFEQKKKLGIVIPDVPVFFKRKFGVVKATETRNIVSLIWEQMNCKKKISFKNLYTFIMSYGNMFWYRPSALKPLTELHWDAKDFPEEPISTNATLAHAIEALPVYVAWNQGYVYKIAMDPEYVLSGFDNDPLLNTEEEKQQIFNSATWRIGRFFAYLPGKIYRCFKPY